MRKKTPKRHYKPLSKQPINMNRAIEDNVRGRSQDARVQAALREAYPEKQTEISREPGTVAPKAHPRAATQMFGASSAADAVAAGDGKDRERS